MDYQRERKRSLDGRGHETEWRDENGDPDRTIADTPEPDDDPLRDPMVRELIDLLGQYHPLRHDPVALRAFRDSLYGTQSGATRSRTSEEDEQFWRNTERWKAELPKKL